MKQLLHALTLTLAASLPALSQQSPPPSPAAPARAEVLVLGTYHMANPGHDVHNMQADDVLVPKRQAEIAQVIAALEKFHPTKVAIESDPFGDRPGQYADYLAGKRELTRNEIEQLGFRLAKELGHKAIYPVDADGEFPYQRVLNYAKSSGRSKEFEAISSVWGDMVKAEGAYLASHTILETLLDINTDDRVALDMGNYYRQAHLGEPGDWAGADLIADWTRRNMRIFSNVTGIIDSPSERVLVIYGSGHLGWLRHAFASDPTLRLRTLAEFAK